MTQPWQVATFRAVLGALLSLALTTLVTYQSNKSWEDGLVAGGVAGLSYLLARGGFEGTYDQKREGPPAQPQAGDVGRPP